MNALCVMCSSCHNLLDLTSFTKNQLKKKRQPRCKNCVQTEVLGKVKGQNKSWEVLQVQAGETTSWPTASFKPKTVVFSLPEEDGPTISPSSTNNKIYVVVEKGHKPGLAIKPKADVTGSSPTLSRSISPSSSSDTPANGATRYQHVSECFNPQPDQCVVAQETPTTNTTKAKVAKDQKTNSATANENERSKDPSNLVVHDSQVSMQIIMRNEIQCLNHQNSELKRLLREQQEEFERQKEMFVRELQQKNMQIAQMFLKWESLMGAYELAVSKLNERRRKDYAEMQGMPSRATAYPFNTPPRHSAESSWSQDHYGSRHFQSSPGYMEQHVIQDRHPNMTLREQETNSWEYEQAKRLAEHKQGEKSYVRDWRYGSGSQSAENYSPRT